MSGTEEGALSPQDQDANASSGDVEKDMNPLRREKTYTFSDAHGWKRYKILQPGKGMYHDVRRRLPYYWSDITDALTYRTVASTVRMYFVKWVLSSALCQGISSDIKGSHKAYYQLSPLHLICTAVQEGSLVSTKDCSVPPSPLWYSASSESNLLP